MHLANGVRGPPCLFFTRSRQTSGPTFTKYELPYSACQMIWRIVTTSRCIKCMGGITAKKLNVRNQTWQGFQQTIPYELSECLDHTCPIAERRCPRHPPVVTVPHCITTHRSSTSLFSADSLRYSYISIPDTSLTRRSRRLVPPLFRALTFAIFSVNQSMLSLILDFRSLGLSGRCRWVGCIGSPAGMVDGLEVVG